MSMTTMTKVTTEEVTTMATKMTTNIEDSTVAPSSEEVKKARKKQKASE